MRVESNGYSFQQTAYGKPARGLKSDDPEDSGRNNNTDKNVQASMEKQKANLEILQLKANEQKVVTHEMAHMSAGGRYAGAAHYEYKTGPDGKRYIVGGEVSIDMSNGKTPQETIQKMEQVKGAALAPADPSSQDRNVAAQAEAAEQKARAELIKEQLNSNKQQTNASPYSATKSAEDKSDPSISVYA